MDPESLDGPDSKTRPGPHGSLTLEILACITAAAIITAAVYPIARGLVSWLG